MKIAIVRLSAIGDIVFSFIAAALIKQKYEGAHITWIVDKRFEEVVKNSPFVDEVVALTLKSFSFGSIAVAVKKLKSLGKFDVVYDLQGLIKSALVGCFVDSPTKIGFSYTSAREGVASFFYTTKVVSAYQKNIVERYIDLLGFGSAAGKPKLLGYSDRAKEKINIFLSKNRKNILINMSASKPNKIYPLEKMSEVAAAFSDENVMILGGEAASLPDMGLDEIKALVDSCDLVIGGDTGITHMAWAMNVPSVTIFGATPAKRNAFETDINRLLYIDEAVDAKKLDYEDFSIVRIEPQEVMRAARELL